MADASDEPDDRQPVPEVKPLPGECAEVVHSNALNEALKARARHREALTSKIIVTGAALLMLVILWSASSWWLTSSSPNADQSSSARQALPNDVSETLPAVQNVDCSASAAAFSDVCKTRSLVIEMLQDVGAQIDAMAVMRPDVWAGDDYPRAVSAAEMAASEFGAHNFDAALIHLNQADRLLAEINLRAAAVAAEAVESGWRFLAAGDDQAAADSFSVALLIQPDNTDAQSGAHRALFYKEVLGFVLSGEAALARKDFEAAAAAFSQALNIDAQDLRAQAGYAQATQEGIRVQLAREIRTGYAAIEKESYASAMDAFGRALALNAQSEAAQQGMATAKKGQLDSRFKSIQSQARVAVDQYRWHDAMNRSAEALALDPASTDMQALHKRAQKAYALEVTLDELLAQPMRLSDATIQQQARNLVIEGRRGEGYGQSIAGKLNALERLVDAMATPKIMTIVSDGKTEVSVDRAMTLGKTERMTIELLPGRYIFRGFRVGYRDVRKEVLVSPESHGLELRMVCDERIP